MLGPNQKQYWNKEAASKRMDPWADDITDVDYPVRRAILMRSLLGLVKTKEKDRENETLNIDHGLLTALLEIDHYRNGARSLEKLILQTKNRGGLPLRRAHLPPDSLLALYVDNVPKFHALIRRCHEFLEKAEKLAPIASTTR